MEEYHRDSLRALRREATAQPIKKRSNRLLTLLIILLFLLAGGFFVATRAGFEPADAKNTIMKWSKDVAEVFKKGENDITETVDAVLAQQDEEI